MPDSKVSSSGHAKLESFLRPAEVRRLTGLSKTTIHRMQREGTFPPFVKLGSRAAGLPESEYERWRADRHGVRPQAAEARP